MAPLQSLSWDENDTPLGPKLQMALRSSNDQVRNSETPSDRVQRSTKAVRFDLPVVLPTRQPRDTQYTTLHPQRAELLGRKITKASSVWSLADQRCSNDLADVPVNVTPQKRPSPSNGTTSFYDEKKPRLQTHDDSDLDKRSKNLVEEEIWRSELARKFSDSGESQRATAEYEKVRKLSNQRKEIGSWLLGQPHRPSATQRKSSRFKKKRHRRHGPLQMPCLPTNSPLNNVINSATLQERRVQARLKFKLAQKQLEDEKLRQGFGSKETLARVKVLNETLATLNKAHGEISKDADRLEEFRRPNPWGHKLGIEESMQTAPTSPPQSPSDREWKNRLTLCYETLQRIEPWCEDRKNEKCNSATLSTEEEPMIKQQPIDQDGLAIVDGAGYQALAMPPPRHAQFALTDVETLL
jgi:hypothetical protein